MEKIKLGVLGCAGIAKKSMIANFKTTDKFEVTAIASRSLSKAKEYVGLFGGVAVEGYQALLDRNDVDCVYIPLPTGLHYEWILKSLDANKHVFAEKSIATNFQEVSEIIEKAKSKKLCVFENFMFTYNQQYEFVQEKIKEGSIGEVKMLRSTFGFPIFDPENNIRYKKELGGGALLDAGAYVLKGAQFVLGTEQKVISSNLQYTNETFPVDFHGYLSLIDQNNVVSQLAFGFDNYYQNTIEVMGTKGKIVVGRAFTSPADFKHKVLVIMDNKVNEHIIDTENQGVRIIRKFADCINREEYSYQYEEILAQSKLLTTVVETHI